jgi:tetratricopeptide (TPR) repeat protein
MIIEKHIKPAAIKKGPAKGARDKSGIVESDKYRSCIKSCNEKISRNHRDELAYIERGNAQLYLDNFKEALNDYQRAIEINPNSIKAYYGMTAVHTTLGLHKTAMYELMKAMELEQQLAEKTPET